MSSELKRVVASRVAASFRGQTLIDYLCSRYTYHPKEEWLRILAAGQLKLNSSFAEPHTVLESEDLVEYLYDEEEPEVNKNFSLLYEDDSLLVVNKPGNLPVHPSGRFFNNTLWALLKKKHDDIYFINRIDRETSGIVLVALNKAVASALGKQFQQRNVTKDYLALVEGEFPEQSIDAKGYLEKDPESEIRRKQIFREAVDFEQYGRQSVHTSFMKIRTLKEISLIKCRIHTGKTHQIRASLQALGWPICGDKIYGLDESFYFKFIRKELTESDWHKLRVQRQTLHAAALDFTHPLTQESLSIEAPLPTDMQNLLAEADA